MNKILKITAFAGLLVSCGRHQPKSGPANTQDVMQYRKTPDSIPQDHTNVDKDPHKPIEKRL